jgi:DNA adenine methylase
MSEKLRRSPKGKRAASKKRSDQGSDPKSNYRIRRKLPDPLKRRAFKGDRGKNRALRDEQIAIPFAPTRGVVRGAQPFLKWVGGKTQLLKQFDRFLRPPMQRYFEPFVGGGAVFFHLKHRFPRMRAFLRDNNDELINAYIAVRDSPGPLIQRLDKHLIEYKADRDRYFYLVRSRHNLERNDRVERAARMIFLNKTCFNGLWRVNGRGEFNVPIGSQKNPTLYDKENIFAASRALADVHLETKDFRETMEEMRKDDFVYVDPPYYPVSATANFTSYTKDDFGPEQQRELAAVFATAALRGVRLLLSNSETEFIRRLYGEFEIHTVRARRMINCDGAKRGHINEVVVLANLT